MYMLQFCVCRNDFLQFGGTVVCGWKLNFMTPSESRNQFSELSLLFKKKTFGVGGGGWIFSGPSKP